MSQRLLFVLRRWWVWGALGVLLVAIVTGWVWFKRPPLLFPQPDIPFHFSPYLDLNLAVEAGTPLANTFFSANTKSIIKVPNTPPFQGLRALTLAFATGECGKEHWGTLNAQRMAMANIPALQQANLGYMISTGGVDGMFTCQTEAGMDAFIQRYQSTHLLGFDFNIEAQQTQEMIQQLVHQVGLAMNKHPELRYSFTLAAIGAGEGNSLNRTGQWVMDAIAKEGMNTPHVNLMVMNYGKADSGSCMVREGRCDMVASAIRAVNNLHRTYKLPLSRIEITPMVGINDETSNVFTLEDAHKLAHYVATNKLGGLHYWSLNRDTSCPQATESVSATCHGLAGLNKLAFMQVFAPLAAPKPVPQ